MARRKVAQDTAARLRAVHQKSARADARRAKHLEQLGEAQRAAAVAERASEVKLFYIRGELELLQVRTVGAITSKSWKEKNEEPRSPSNHNTDSSCTTEYCRIMKEAYLQPST